MVSKIIQIGDAEVLAAGLAEFDRIEAGETQSGYEKTCGRDAVRGMMVRLNLYSAFLLALEGREAKDCPAMPDEIVAWPADVSPGGHTALTGIWSARRHYSDEAVWYVRKRLMGPKESGDA